MKKIKILHAPAIVINQQWIISRAQRKLGHISDVMTFNADRIGLLARDCDTNLHFDRNDISLKPSKILKTLKFIISFKLFFLKALCKYDIFHFHSESFLGSMLPIDLMILRLFRKKIVFQYWGCDIRLKTMSVLAGDFSTCDDCIRACNNSRKLRDNLTHLHYCDFRVYGGADCIKNVPDALFIPIAVDLEKWDPTGAIPEAHRLPKTDSVRILQAFENSKTRGDQKGTRFIKAAVEALRKEGLKIDYVFLDSIPYNDIKYYYQQADIVIDQLLTGWHGSVTVEAMAMGKPAICYLNQDALRLLPEDNPIVNADPGTIKDAIKRLVVDGKLREDLGRRSRKYIEEHHDAMKLAKEYIDLYNKDWR